MTREEATQLVTTNLPWAMLLCAADAYDACCECEACDTAHAIWDALHAAGLCVDCGLLAPRPEALCRCCAGDLAQMLDGDL